VNSGFYNITVLEKSTDSIFLLMNWYLFGLSFTDLRMNKVIAEDETHLEYYLKPKLTLCLILRE